MAGQCTADTQQSIALCCENIIFTVFRNNVCSQVVICGNFSCGIAPDSVACEAGPRTRRFMAARVSTLSQARLSKDYNAQAGAVLLT
jgi:hypothetical protein